MFVIEGVKAVNELLTANFKAFGLYATEPGLFLVKGDLTDITDKELRQLSSLKTPNKVLGVFYMPLVRKVSFADCVVALDGIKDPGNLGTIIRLCDWFGIEHLICSPESVDCYNPKVLQATMGSIARVNVVYQELSDMMNMTTQPVYGAFMEGQRIYDTSLPGSGILVLGNEANGISEKMEKLVTKKIGIPQFGFKSTESLNVAVATAILLNEIRRP
jgi:TrmH family RNA methyltransferase